MKTPDLTAGFRRSSTTVLILLFAWGVPPLSSVAHGASERAEVPDADAWSRFSAADPERCERVQAFVERLRGEQFEDSVSALDEVEPYFWPGASTGAFGLPATGPLPPGLDRFDVDTIRSNRRFLKVISGLSALPADVAGKMISDEIRRTLPQYEALYHDQVEGLAGMMRELKARGQTPPVGGTSLQVSNNADGTPTLGGLRLKLLALVWCAGIHGLVDAGPGVQDVVDVAVKQRDALYAENADIGRDARLSLLVSTSLYNRQLIATGVLGVCPSPGLISDVQSQLKIEWTSLTTPDYDVPVTEFDRKFVPEVAAPDIPQEPLPPIRVVAPLDDATFDLLRSRCAPHGGSE